MTLRRSSACSTRPGRRLPRPAPGRNFIVGFPGETEHDLEVLCDFLGAARLDAIGIFGYSDEDGTEAVGFDGKLDEDEIRERVAHVTALAEELTAQRAEERIGERVVVLVESVEDGVVEGRAAHQGPEVDGSTTVEGVPDRVAVGDMIQAVVVGSEGVDLVARVPGSPRARRRVDEPAGACCAGEQLERPQRPHDAADRDGALLRLGPAARRRGRRSAGAGWRSCCSASP